VIWLLVPAAYLVGSVQWGLYMVRWTKRIDVRTVGSGKTGTTNVLRTAGKSAAIVVLLMDALKGLAMVLVARLLSDDVWLHAAVATAAVAGHIWPVLAGFKGGRGIATGLGATFGLGWLGAALGVCVFIPLVALTRYVSLGSVLGVAAVIVSFAALMVWSNVPPAYFLYTAIAGGTIIVMHKDNIRRLLAGTERRIGQRVGE
jgi:glycerol-3-phosphate acyltransferase PlsY